MTLKTSLILFFVVFLSGISVLYLRRIGDRVFRLLLAFSGSYLLAISVLHLLPDIYHSHSTTIGAFILAGFLLQVFLEIATGGLEHGHVHLHNESNKKFPLVMIIGLYIHSFLEGMPLAGVGLEHAGHDHENPLLIGILLHKLPISLVLVTLLINSGISRKLTMIYLVLFALMAPLGLWLSHFISLHWVKDVQFYLDIILAVVVGIFLHVSTTILFESTDDHRFNRVKFLAIFLGALLAFLHL